MMEREVHLTAKKLLESVKFRDRKLGSIAFISGQRRRVDIFLEKLSKPVKNFTVLGHSFWTGIYKGKDVTVGSSGSYAPEAAIINEVLCEAGIGILVRVGSCGALRRDIEIGDFIVADEIFRGEGTTPYYVDDSFSPAVDFSLCDKLVNIFKPPAKIYRGAVWTTDALLRETKDIVNRYVRQGAIAVDMVTSSFVTIANLYNKKASVIMVVSDNLITGTLGFTDARLFEAERRLAENIFKLAD
ncbi:MAG: hypothetical protein ABH858_01065 [Candidatus Omnitrophota bacterium]